MELPKEFKGTIYFYWNAEFDFIHISKHGNSSDPEYLLMGKIENVNVQFNKTHDQAVMQMVDNLKQQKKNIQADTQSKLNEIDDKINSLLAITYQGDDK